MTQGTVDPHDPTDDEDVPAVVEDVDESEPVEEEEGDPNDLATPPDSWGESLDDEDWDERLDGVDTSPVPGDDEE